MLHFHTTLVFKSYSVVLYLGAWILKRLVKEQLSFYNPFLHLSAQILNVPCIPFLSILVIYPVRWRRVVGWGFCLVLGKEARQGFDGIKNKSTYFCFSIVHSQVTGEVTKGQEFVVEEI